MVLRTSEELGEKSLKNDLNFQMELLPLQQLLAECSWCLSLGIYED